MCIKVLLIQNFLPNLTHNTPQNFNFVTDDFETQHVSLSPNFPLLNFELYMLLFPLVFFLVKGTAQDNKFLR